MFTSGAGVEMVIDTGKKMLNFKTGGGLIQSKLALANATEDTVFNGRTFYAGGTYIADRPGAGNRDNSCSAGYSFGEDRLQQPRTADHRYRPDSSGWVRSARPLSTRPIPFRMATTWENQRRLSLTLMSGSAVTRLPASSRAFRLISSGVRYPVSSMALRQRFRVRCATRTSRARIQRLRLAVTVSRLPSANMTMSPAPSSATSVSGNHPVSGAVQQSSWLLAPLFAMVGHVPMASIVEITAFANAPGRQLVTISTF